MKKIMIIREEKELTRKIISQDSKRVDDIVQFDLDGEEDISELIKEFDQLEDISVNYVHKYSSHQQIFIGLCYI